MLLSAFVFAGCSPTSPTPTPTGTPTSDAPTSGKIAGFVASDLAQHARASDCWIGVDGAVYDVTSYANVHPGGVDVIVKYCGKDATTAFHTMDGRGKDHPGQATAMLKNYYKGVLQ